MKWTKQKVFMSETETWETEGFSIVKLRDGKFRVFERGFLMSWDLGDFSSLAAAKRRVGRRKAQLKGGRSW